MARTQPNQPPQPSRAKAKSKHSQGRNGKQPLQPPQPSLAEAQAEANAEPQGNLQAQPPQPPLGNVPNEGKQKVKPRRRRGRKGKKPSRTAPSTSKRPRDDEECEQAEVKPQSKRLRVDSPPVASQDGGFGREETVPARPIKPQALPIRRSSTPFFPRQSCFQTSDFKPPKPSKSSISSSSKQEPTAASAHTTAFRLQRSKLHRANLKAKRDFPRTLESLACVSNSDTDSEYTPISRADSIPTSGQSTPEASPEPISNEDLFGLRAKPCSPIPSTPSTWSVSSDTDDVA